jgi:hypothetical protein
MRVRFAAAPTKQGIDISPVSDQEDGDQPVIVENSIDRAVAPGWYPKDVSLDLFGAPNRARNCGKQIEVVPNTELVRLRQLREFFDSFRVDFDR